MATFLIENPTLQVYTDKACTNNNDLAAIKAGDKIEAELVTGTADVYYITDYYPLKNPMMAKKIAETGNNPYIGRYVRRVKYREYIGTDENGNPKYKETFSFEKISEVKISNNTGAYSVINSDGSKSPQSTENVNNGITTPSTIDYVRQSASLVEYDEYYSEVGNTTRTTNEYINNISKGYTVKNIRGIMGAPHQFMPLTDIRTTEGSEFSHVALGRMYTKHIVRTIPLLLITPGIPEFLKADKESKKSLLESLFTGSYTNLTNVLSGNGNQYSRKYYNLKFKVDDYYRYVNTMLRLAAIILGVAGKKVDGKNLSNYDWMYNDGAQQNTNPTGSTWRKYFGYFNKCVALYANMGESVNDTFSNETTVSQLASSMNSISDKAREINFIMGNVAGNTGTTNILEGAQSGIQDMVGSLASGGGVIGNILNKAQALLAGGRLVFPEIWQDSKFSRSYSANMRLVASSGNNFAYYMDILVPYYHVLCMCLPKQSETGDDADQVYNSPFLLRCYYKGQFNIDMGIISSLSVTKGAEAEWTIYGLPTVVELQFEIKDMYEVMFMSKSNNTGIVNDPIFSNTAELDYIANSCGINLNDMTFSTLANVFIKFSVGKINDILNPQNWIPDQLRNLGIQGIFDWFKR